MSKAIVVVGLAYDEVPQKRAVDYLCNAYPVDLVVRTNPGRQTDVRSSYLGGMSLPAAGHYLHYQGGAPVVRSPSSSLPTYLGPSFPVSLPEANQEAEWYRQRDIGVPSLYAHPDATLVLELHRELARRRLQPSVETGVAARPPGVDEALSYAPFNPTLCPRLRHLRDPAHLRYLVTEYARVMRCIASHRDYSQEPWPRDVAEEFEHELAAGSFELGRVRVRAAPPPSKLALFDGGPGILCDARYGFPPAVVFGDCTDRTAVQLATTFGYSPYVLGVVTPLAEYPSAAICPTRDPYIKTRHVAFPDFPLLRYAADACGQLHGVMTVGMFSYPVRGRSVATAYLGDAPTVSPVPTQAGQRNLVEVLRHATPVYRNMSGFEFFAQLTELAPVATACDWCAYYTKPRDRVLSGGVSLGGFIHEDQALPAPVPFRALRKAAELAGAACASASR